MSFRLFPVVVAVPVLALVIWAQAQESAPESTVTSLLPEPAADKVASGVKAIGVCSKTVGKLIAEDRLGCVFVGTRRLIPVLEIQRWLDREAAQSSDADGIIEEMKNV